VHRRRDGSDCSRDWQGRSPAKKSRRSSIRVWHHRLGRRSKDAKTQAGKVDKITERTPSVPQYFSWINNTNEGSAEEHTLTNLDFFKWLYDEYGMRLGIYAFDAGNIDYAQS
jgi:hypothetical protein